MARVQFELADRSTHEATVDEGKLDSHKLPVGATLPVVYTPDNPADVRARMSWERLKVPLGLFAVGSLCLALAFGAPFGALFAWAFRGRTPQDHEERVAAALQDHAPTAMPVSTVKDDFGIPGRRAAPINAFPRTTGAMGRASFGMRK
jgi:hypothetical protein